MSTRKLSQGVKMVVGTVHGALVRRAAGNGTARPVADIMTVFTLRETSSLPRPLIPTLIARLVRLFSSSISGMADPVDGEPRPVRATAEQIGQLQEAFLADAHPAAEIKQRLADLTGL